VNFRVQKVLSVREREFFIANLLGRIHFIIVMMRWTGLAPWDFEFAGLRSRARCSARGERKRELHTSVK